jgi:hypothetical protein
LHLSFERKEQAKKRLPKKRAKSPTFVPSLQLPFRAEEQAKKGFGRSKRTLQGFVLKLATKFPSEEIEQAKKKSWPDMIMGDPCCR